MPPKLDVSSAPTGRQLSFGLQLTTLTRRSMLFFSKLKPFPGKIHISILCPGAGVEYVLGVVLGDHTASNCGPSGSNNKKFDAGF